MARATRGIPPTGATFFPGTPFEPPRAGMIAMARGWDSVDIVVLSIVRRVCTGELVESPANGRVGTREPPGIRNTGDRDGHIPVENRPEGDDGAGGKSLDE